MVWWHRSGDRDICPVSEVHLFSDLEQNTLVLNLLLHPQMEAVSDSVALVRSD